MLEKHQALRPSTRTRTGKLRVADSARTAHGFTLAETLVVVATVGVLIIGIAGVVHMLPAWRVEAASRNIAAVLRAAQAQAVIQGGTVAVPFDASTGRYTSVSESSAGGAILAGTDREIALPSGVLFGRPDVGSAITFSPPAAPADTVALFGNRGMLLSLNRPADVYVGHTDSGTYRRVRVNLAGAVRVSRWTGTTWE
jgi:Tfp pilus assembly protein FimT